MKCAASGSLKIQDAKIRQLRSIAQLCRAISSQLRRASTIGKKLLNGNISSTCSHNMVNFGPLMAEIGWRVGTLCGVVSSRDRAAIPFDIGRSNCLVGSCVKIGRRVLRWEKRRNLSDPRERCLQLKSSVILFPKSQISLRYPARELVRSRFEAGRRQVRSWFEPVCDRTRFRNTITQ